MGKERNWTKEEIIYLQDNYGTLSYGKLAKNLKRSVDAIKVKRQKLGLGAFLDNGDYVTFHQLLGALGYGKSGSGYKQISWVKNREFPMHTKRVNHCSFRVVYLDEFWEWAEKNRDLLDFSNFEEYALGEEPAWAKLKRKLDYQHKRKYKTTPWTKMEDTELIRLVKLQKHSYDELSKMLGRTNGAIQRRLCDLKISDRPIKADNHTEWTEEDRNQLGEFIKQGYKYDMIAEQIGKSSKAVRGYVYRHYITENLDKVNSYIGDGQFGDNLPEKRIKDFRIMTLEERTEVRELLERLTGLMDALVQEDIKEQGWSEWSNLCKNYCRDCIKNGFHCDECVSYKRIDPQNCKMCGITFYEREINLYCKKCRTQRKKNYIKKKLIMSRRTSRQ